MSDKNMSIPFEALGARLKDLREGSRESLAEAAGAVEIEEKSLFRIESGQDRPSEDILLLLISHFNIEDDMAAELWQLAGYDKQKEKDDDATQAAKTTMMVMIDPRVMYTDQVEIVANKQGVIVNFSQSGSVTEKHPLVVSRIGMSRDQAKTVMGLLHQALYEIDQPDNRRQLGDGTTDSSN